MTGNAAADLYGSKLMPAEQAVASVTTGETVSCGMAMGQPPALLAALADRIRAGELGRIRLYYKIAMEPLQKTLLAEDVIEKVDAHSFFIGAPDHEIIKRQVQTGLKVLSFVPVHFSQLPRLFEEFIELDTFLITVSPMDGSGFFSLGTNNDFASTAARRAKRLIVEVNRNMPWVFGSQIHVSEVDAIVENHVPVMAKARIEPSSEGNAIGALVAPMVADGATIQIGIGRVTAGVVLALQDHTDLGIHSEMLSTEMADLIQKGAVTGTRKTLDPRRHVFTVALGTTDFYAFMNDNPAIESRPSSYTNDIRTIAQQDNFGFSSPFCG